MDKNRSQCDIVLSVYNGLAYVKECISSIVEHTADYHLYVVDDCSDDFTRRYLEKVKKNNPQISLYRNPKNLGFVKSSNLGVSLGKAPFIVLINSDVIVTPGWLEQLIKCADSSPSIALVNPFTNSAATINIPMAPGANFYGMNMILQQNSPPQYPDVVTGVGFCMLLRRSALENVGLFDEVYGRGYCEESDLCMRFTTSGYRTVVADDVYVYHKGRGSFNDRGGRYKQNRKIFDARWAEEYYRQFSLFRKADPLNKARGLFQLHQMWDTESSMRETYRSMRSCWRTRDLPGFLREAVRGLRRLPNAKREVVTPEAVVRVTRPGRLRVTYVLHHLCLAGGVFSVVQLVNELILLGVEARIVALREYPEVYDWKLLTRPIIFKKVSTLIRDFPESDITIATHWTTAPWVSEIVSSGRGGIGAYFLQDYESWFFHENDKESRGKVLKTYKLIPNKIVKSEWLKALLERDGFPTKKIRLGMDLGLFYPRNVKKSSRPIVLTMARPRTPRRGFPHVIEALRKIKQSIPEVEIVLFGDDLSKQNIPFDYRDEGVITDQSRLAELYSTADVFLDGSDFQGFGRTALEAMSCGTACVLTSVGGVSEYAKDKKNCLLVPPARPEVFAQAILTLLKNEGFREHIIQGGRETALSFCHKREAEETLMYFNELSQTGR